MTEATAIIGRIATAVTGVASVSTEGSAEGGPVGQTERGQGVEGAGATGPASAEGSATAEPTLLQKVYNWLMT